MLRLILVAATLSRASETDDTGDYYNGAAPVVEPAASGSETADSGAAVCSLDSQDEGAPTLEWVIDASGQPTLSMVAAGSEHFTYSISFLLAFNGEMVEWVEGPIAIEGGTSALLPLVLPPDAFVSELQTENLSQLRARLLVTTDQDIVRRARAGSIVLYLDGVGKPGMAEHWGEMSEAGGLDEDGVPRVGAMSDLNEEGESYIITGVALADGGAK